MPRTARCSFHVTVTEALSGEPQIIRVPVVYDWITLSSNHTVTFHIAPGTEENE